MNKLDMVSWEEIYDYWRLYNTFGPSILNQPILPVELFVDYSKHDGIFYGYDWLYTRRV